MKRAEELLRKYPSLANVPVAVVGGKPVTLKELVEMARSGNEEALGAVEKLGIDPEEDELKELAKEFWMRSLPEGVRVHILGYGSLTKDEVIRNIERGTEVGKKFIDMYMKFIRRLSKLA